MERYTRKNAENAFDRLCKALNKRKATTFNDVGAWRLDYAACYGGFNVEEITSEHGAVKHPFGPWRRNAREFCDAVSFLCDGIHALKS